MRNFGKKYSSVGLVVWFGNEKGLVAWMMEAWGLVAWMMEEWGLVVWMKEEEGVSFRLKNKGMFRMINDVLHRSNFD